MKDFIAGLFFWLLLILILVWTIIFILGSAEILWWIFTGDFFHFVSTGAEVVF